MAEVPAFCAQDYPEYTFDVISPELPCGVAWLVNCLLELNIPIWRPWDIDIEKEWVRKAPFHYQYAESEEPWKQTLPALQHLRDFQFGSKHAGCVRHQWPCSHQTERPMIFFVRDPRDALFSYWRRAKHNEAGFNQSFESFVHSPYFHHPFSFREYLLTFTQLWKNQLNGHEHLIVRFEDYRTDAVRTLNQVLSFLNVRVTNKSLNRAIFCSDFSAIKRVEDQMEAQAKLKRRFNYAGIAFEYQKHFTAAMHDSLGPDFDDICKWLGYASYEEASRSQSVIKICAVS